MGGNCYNCDGCGDIFADVDVYAYCEGCTRHFCRQCGDQKNVFFVGDDIRCWLCYNPRDRVVSEKELLFFCLEQLNWTRSDTLERFKRTRAYLESLDGTQCTECGFDGCQTLEEPFQTQDKTFRAGVCCGCCKNKAKVCEHCKSRAFMERWMAPHKVMRDAGIPKDVVVKFAKRIKSAE